VVKTRQGLLGERLPAFQKAIDLSEEGTRWAEFGIAMCNMRRESRKRQVATIRRGLESRKLARGVLVSAMALLRLNRLMRLKSAREALLRKPQSRAGLPGASDAYGRRKEYLEQLQGLEAYLKLEPNGARARAPSGGRDG